MMQAIKVLAVVFITFLVIDIIQGLYLENGNQFRLGRRTTRGPQSRSSADESDTFHSVMGKNTLLRNKRFMLDEIVLGNASKGGGTLVIGLVDISR